MLKRILGGLLIRGHMLWQVAAVSTLIYFLSLTFFRRDDLRRYLGFDRAAAKTTVGLYVGFKLCEISARRFWRGVRRENAGHKD
jgi:hypothetical protein